MFLVPQNHTIDINNAQDLAHAIYNGRKINHGVKQETLAKCVGIHRGWISEAENGKEHLDFTIVLKVLRELGYCMKIVYDPKTANLRKAEEKLETLKKDYESSQQ